MPEVQQDTVLRLQRLYRAYQIPLPQMQGWIHYLVQGFPYENQQAATCQIGLSDCPVINRYNWISQSYWVCGVGYRSRSYLAPYEVEEDRTSLFLLFHRCFFVAPFSASYDQRTCSFLRLRRKEFFMWTCYRGGFPWEIWLPAEKKWHEYKGETKGWKIIGS